MSIEGNNKLSTGQINLDFNEGKDESLLIDNPEIIQEVEKRNQEARENMQQRREDEQAEKDAKKYADENQSRLNLDEEE